MLSLAVACSLLVVCSAAVTRDVKKPVINAPASEADTFHCLPNTNVAVINGNTLPIYVCRLGDIAFILAAEGHAQAHLDLTLDHEAVKSLSDDYLKRGVKRQKRQFFGGGAGFSGSSANAGSGSFTSGFGTPLGGFGGGGSHAGAGATSFSNAGGGGFATPFGLGGFGR